MANWAMVVGIDQYWLPKVCLQGAVNDALRVRDWLLDRAGGNVPDTNLVSLLSPLPDRVLPPGLNHLPATSDNVILQSKELVKRSGGSGDRLYFYFAGHGLSVEVALNKHEHALLTTDFTYDLTDQSMELGSLLAYFKTTSFADQFFIIDACRNVLAGDRFEIRRFPTPPARDFSKPEPQQFVVFATSPGVRAAEDRHAGQEGGAFTRVLVEALTGERDAKAYDIEDDCYVVRWGAMFDYVKSKLEARKENFGDGAALIQIPRRAGESGAAGRDSNPELARFDSARFPRERLNVYVDPQEAVKAARVQVYDLGNPEPVESKPVRIEGQPTSFDLPPRTYTVFANSAGFQRNRKPCVADLYAPRDVRVGLERAPAERAARSIDFGFAASPPAASPVHDDAAIEARASDPLALLEIVDVTEKLIARGNGHLEVRSLRPGGYRVRLRTPEGAVTEELIDLKPGEWEQVDMDAPTAKPTPAMAHLAGRVMQFDHRNMVHLSERLGAMVGVELSTVVTLSGLLTTYPPAKVLGWGHKLASVGLRGVRDSFPPNATSGIYVVFADEKPPWDGARITDYLQIRLWPLGAPRPEQHELPRIPENGPPGVAEFARATSPGQHWFAIGAPDRPTTGFALHVLEGHLSFVVVHRRTDDDVMIMQHTPPLEPRNPAAGPDALQRARHLDMVQRRLLYEQFGDIGDPRELLTDATEEPLTRLIGAALLLRAQGQAASDTTLREAIDLTTRFPQFSDGYVLLAESLMAQGRNADARVAYASALNHGFPTFVGNLSRLATAIEQLGIRHERRALLAALVLHRVPGVLWTSFTPIEVIDQALA